MGVGTYHIFIIQSAPNTMINDINARTDDAIDVESNQECISQSSSTTPTTPITQSSIDLDTADEGDKYKTEEKKELNQNDEIASVKQMGRRLYTPEERVAARRAYQKKHDKKRDSPETLLRQSLKERRKRIKSGSKLYQDYIYMPGMIYNVYDMGNIGNWNPYFCYHMMQFQMFIPAQATPWSRSYTMNHSPSSFGTSSTTDNKRTHDMPASIATTKNDTTSTNASSSSQDDMPAYQIVKEGRVSGYLVLISQVGSEHDAILLGCKTNDNPQDYLNNRKDGKVKIRWKFAGYNDLVPTNTVRLKVVDRAPRKAAVLSGLLETAGDAVITNGNNNEASARSTAKVPSALHPVESDKDINNDKYTHLNQSPIPVPSVCISNSSSNDDNAYDQDTDDEDATQMDSKPDPVPSSCISGNLDSGYDLDTDNEDMDDEEEGAIINTK